MRRPWGLSAGTSGFLSSVPSGRCRYALQGQEGQAPGRAPPLSSLEMPFPDTTSSPQPAEPPDQARPGQALRCCFSPGWPGWCPRTGWLIGELPPLHGGHPIPQRSVGNWCGRRGCPGSGHPLTTSARRLMPGAGGQRSASLGSCPPLPQWRSTDQLRATTGQGCVLRDPPGVPHPSGQCRLLGSASDAQVA